MNTRAELKCSILRAYFCEYIVRPPNLRWIKYARAFAETDSISLHVREVAHRNPPKSNPVSVLRFDVATVRALLIHSCRVQGARGKTARRKAARAVGRGQGSKSELLECRLRFQVLRFVVHRLGDAELVFHAAAAAAARVLQHAPICTPALS